MDRSRPLPDNAAMMAAPHGKGMGRLLMTVLFLVSAVMVLNLRVSRPHLRLGQVARKEYRARVDVLVPDDEADRRKRDAAADRATRVFQENTDHMDRLSRDLGEFLNRVGDPTNVEEIPRADYLEWGLTHEKLRALRRLIDLSWIRAGIEAVGDAQDKVVRAGIIRGIDEDSEFEAGRHYIQVRPWDPTREPERRAIVRMKDHPTGVRIFFAEELDVWLRDKPGEFRDIVLDMLVHAAKPTLKLDEEATDRVIEAACNTVRPSLRRIAKGSLILGIGDKVTEKALEEIEKEAEEFARVIVGTRQEAVNQEWERMSRRALSILGTTSIFLLGFLLLALYGLYFASDVLASNTRVCGIYAVCLLTLVALRLLEQFSIALHWTPVILLAMILAVATGPMLAFGATVLLSLVAGIATNAGIALSLPLLVSGSVAVLALRRVLRHTDPLHAGALAGAAYAATVWGLHLARMPLTVASYDWPIGDSLAGLLGGIAAGIILWVTVPFVERFFDVATDRLLLEWTDQNQPLLRKLALEAPGTYHHSTVVSHMAETAAKAVGANPLLARAGAYLHDVGKLNRPDYFIENALGNPSRHDRLTPMMSALILTAHTQDGSEIARRYGVPRPLRRVIEEHHGTSLAGFFCDKAREQAKDADAEVQEEMFRYRGPKPLSPESAIVMLADAIESAARTLDDASAGRIERLVHAIVDARLSDGQFDESRMTITDVRRVEASLVRSLIAVSHPRIRYPSI